MVAATSDNFRHPGLFQQVLKVNAGLDNAGDNAATYKCKKQKIKIDTHADSEISLDDAKEGAGRKRTSDVDFGMPQNSLHIYKAQNCHGVRGVQPGG